jgi:transcription antitermination factor NusG
MQWYILQVYSGNEKKIERELLAQIEKKICKITLKRF